jgi:hypothetical protein
MTQAFNLSQFANKVNTSGQADLTTAVTGTLPKGNGGTGLTTPGTSGNVLMSDGTDWVSGTIYPVRNRIINGDMRIDQRNAGASVTASTTGNEIYTLDRWSYFASQASKFSVQQNAAAVTPPAGFTNYLGITSSSAYSITSSDWFTIKQSIEGFNGSDLGWGTANAKTVTLSFWVRSSLTGTFGGSVRNSLGNRSYPFSYSIPVANTWTLISITIAGDTSGTWATDNTTFAQIFFGLGVGSSNSGTAGAWAASGFGSATGATSVVGTNGATFYITGVQLEQGSTATPFERRLYNQELANCQRYFEKSYPISVVPGANSGNGAAFSTQNVGVTTASYILTWVNYKVQKRTDATVSVWDTVGNSGKCTRFTLGSSTNTNQNITIDLQGESAMEVYSGNGENRAGIALQWTASAEL